MYKEFREGLQGTTCTGLGLAEEQIHACPIRMGIQHYSKALIVCRHCRFVAF